MRNWGDFMRNWQTLRIDCHL